MTHHDLPKRGPSPIPSQALPDDLPKRRPSHDALFWLLQCGGWIVYGLVLTIASIKEEPIKPAVLDSVLFVLIGFPITLVYRYIFRSWRRRGMSLPKTGLAIALIALVGALLMWEMQTLIVRSLLLPYPSWLLIVPSYTDISLGYGLTMSTALIGWSLLYFGINSWMGLEAERIRTLVAEAAAQEARALALQAQLQPHFLFNTLNGVSALIVDNRGDEAAQMIAGLGSLLRMSLQSADAAFVPLERELEFLRQYLEIEKTKFGDRLNYRFEIMPNALTATVPTLLLLPLVENALRHGIFPKKIGGLIVIRALVEDGMVRLQVTDDGRGWQSSSSQSPGIGLANTARRMDELFGERGQFEISRSEAGGVTVDIAIPVEPAFRQREARRQGNG